MKGEIKKLFNMPALTQQVFHPRFHSIQAISTFVNSNLVGGSVTQQLCAPSAYWTKQSFQALFITCWIHHPVEKGTYMISLRSIGNPDNAAGAIEDKLVARKSSHLAGKHKSKDAFSAADASGFVFLAGYKELLVQYELVNGVPFLMLKPEGYTTQTVKDAILHGKNYVIKSTNSKVLNKIAKTDPGLIAPRNAESFDDVYKDLLKVIGLKGNKNVTVRQMFKRLCERTGHNFRVADGAENKFLGGAIKNYCNLLRRTPGKTQLNMNGTITAEMVDCLYRLGETHQQDSVEAGERFYQEVRVTPEELEQSFNNFIT